MARVAIASMLVGAALAQFPPPPSAPAAFCLPSQWSGEYTRVSDTGAAVGNVTHSYLDKFFAIRENARGAGKNGSFVSYGLEYIQNGTHTWAGIKWSDGSMNCYKSNNGNPVFDKRCMQYGGTDVFQINGKPSTSGYNVIAMKNNSMVEVEVMVVSKHYPHLPAQSWSWDASTGQRRSPSYVFVHNARPHFNERIAKIPEVCMKAAIEEGPVADKALQFFARRAALKSEEGHWVHPQAPKAAAPAADALVKGLPGAQPRKVRSCLPNSYNGGFYYMSDNFTVNGLVTHNFALQEFAVMENITGNGINSSNPIRTRFIQKGFHAWVISESANGSITKCSSAPVAFQYDERCHSGYQRHISVNGAPAAELHMVGPGTGNGQVYQALYTSKHTGLPIGVLNFTDATKGGANGNPKSISFFNPSFGVNHKILKLPSTCNADASAKEEVEKVAKKYRAHLLTSFA